MAETASAPPVTLREITEHTVRAVTKLSVADDQLGLVASNAVSLAQALFSDCAWYRAIYSGEELAGFVMIADDTLRKILLANRMSTACARCMRR